MSGDLRVSSVIIAPSQKKNCTMWAFRSMRAELNKTFILIIKLIARYEVVGAKSFLRSPELCCPVHTQLFEHENFLRAVFSYLLFMTIWFVSYQSGG